MPSFKPHFAVRVERGLLDKFKFVAEYNARSANREIEMLMKEHVAKFEADHGPIIIDESFSRD